MSFSPEGAEPEFRPVRGPMQAALSLLGSCAAPASFGALILGFRGASMLTNPSVVVGTRLGAVVGAVALLLLAVLPFAAGLLTWRRARVAGASAPGAVRRAARPVLLWGLLSLGVAVGTSF